MNKDQGRELITRYINDTATTTERQIVEKWYAVELLRAGAVQQEEDYGQIKRDIWSLISQNIERVENDISYRSWISVAAAILLVLGFSVIGYYFIRDSDQKEQLMTSVPPGEVGATLTLSDGRQIDLTQLNIEEDIQDGEVFISRDPEGGIEYRVSSHNLLQKYNTLTTARGQTYMVILPDKTKVWLNASSKLMYSNSMIDDTVRRVRLVGEAYFEVKKSQLPFLVETKDQSVRVLGTHFNIHAYEDESVSETTLVEGSVAVSSGTKKIILKPGEQSINNSGKIIVKPVDFEGVVSWKNGYFKFDGTLETVMRSLSRWYNVELFIEDDVPNNIKLWGYVSRSNNLLEVLQQIERVNKVTFQVKNKKIIVRKREM